jgi:hypothetical protein
VVGGARSGVISPRLSNHVTHTHTVVRVSDSREEGHRMRVNDLEEGGHVG